MIVNSPKKEHSLIESVYQSDIRSPKSNQRQVPKYTPNEQYYLRPSQIKSPSHQQSVIFIGYKFPNGDTYDGDWQGKLPHGKGTYEFAKQNLQYKGDFVNGKIEGKGILKRTKGQEIIYDGQWKNGQKNGIGKFRYSFDSFYEGQWKNGIKNGFGKYTSKTSTYEGEWRNNLREGKGKLSLIDGTYFVGRFQKGQFCEGDVHYSNKDIYQGQIKNGLRQGNGKYFNFIDNQKYQGLWKANKKHGLGTMQYGNGDKIQGVWNQGELDQSKKCLYFWSDGSIFEGLLKNGSLSVGKIKTQNEIYDI